MNRRYQKLLVELLSLPTAPMNEHEVMGYIQAWARQRAAVDLRQDRYGNILLQLKRGRAAGKSPLLFCAHMDHPGFEAAEMIGKNRLRAIWRGGVLPDYFRNAKVRFHEDGRWVRGQVQSVKVVEVNGRRRVQSAEITVRGAVSPGAIGMWDFPDPRIRGEILHARGCDDIAGVAAILAMFEDLLRSRKAVHVYGLLTRAEEVGFAGALAATGKGEQRLPKSARIISVEISSEIPGVKMGEGPILRVGDAMSIFDPDFTAFCAAVAHELAREDKQFQYQRRLMDGGVCEASPFVLRGYAATGLCLALGNYHNMNRRTQKIGAEYIHLRDFERLVRWFIALATTRLKPEQVNRQRRKQMDEREKQFRSELIRSARRQQ